MAHASAAPVLVLGATGGFGGAMVGALRAAGRPVRVLSRRPARPEARWGGDPGVEVVAGDVEERARVVEAAAGCPVIVHGVNYPHDRWVPYMQTATNNVIAAARAARALVLFPGNVYGLGAQTAAPLDETAPMRARTRKGLIRIRLEQSLEEATKDTSAPVGEQTEAPTLPPIRVLVLRAGDYFGPTARNGVVDRIFCNAVKGKRIEVFGRLDVPHEWVYLPDLARIGVNLLDRTGAFAPYEVVHARGHVSASQRDFVSRVAERAGAPTDARVLPWPLVRLHGLFDGAARELVELRYLFDSAVTLDDAKLRRIVPDSETTPLDAAIDATLESYRR